VQVRIFKKIYPDLAVFRFSIGLQDKGVAHALRRALPTQPSSVERNNYMAQRRPSPSSTELSRRQASSSFQLTPLARALHGALICVALGAASGVMPSAIAQTAAPAAEARRSFAIPAGTLDQALMRFGRDAGVLISVNADLTAGRQSPGLRGSYTVPEGIAALLAGSGLEAVRGANGGYSLRRAASAAGAADQAQTLPEVTVTAANGNAATTEGTGSYTTKSMSTATRMGLSIRDTPQSVSVVTRQRIEDMGLNTIADVLVQSTGITVQENDTERMSFSSRGFSISNFQVDGVAANYSAGNSAPFDTAIYDRVEVVRGATGLLTGAGDPSATVNMVRKRPGKQFAGSAAATVGSWDFYRVEGDISTPFTEDGRVRGRFVAAYQDRKSFLDLYQEKKQVGSAVLEADLTPQTLLSASIDYQHNDPRGTTWGTTPLFFSDGSAASLPRSFNVAADWSRWEREFQNKFVSLEHAFDNEWKLKGTFSRMDLSSEGKLFYGGGGYPNRDGSGLTVWSGYFPYEEKQDNIDLYASGPFTLLGRKHELVVGWNGWKREGMSPATAMESPVPATIPNFWQWDGKVPEFRAWKTGASSVATTEQSGAYGAVRFNVADPLKVILGARLSSWKTRNDSFNAAGQKTRTTAQYQAEDVVTPYAGALFDLNSNYSLYASYTDLFKPQNYKDRNGEFLDPITGSNVEAGIKGEFFDGGLNASLAYFQARQDNLAEEDPSVPANFLLPDGSRPYVSTGKGTKTDGVELDVSGMLAPGWQLYAGYTRATSKDAKGQRINTIQPREIFRVSTSYRLPGEWKRLTVGGGVNWQSEIYTTATSPAGKVRTSQPGYTLLNLMARYQFSDKMSANLNINNALDKTYYRRVGFYNGGYYGEPRSVMLTLRYQY
jgi:outer membrane receptor for ferric coprogen and ferric-rhodotorulic acid